MNKRGRPKKEITRNTQFRIRMTNDEYNELEALSKHIGTDKAKTIRLALLELRNKLANSQK